MTININGICKIEWQINKKKLFSIMFYMNEKQMNHRIFFLNQGKMIEVLVCFAYVLSCIILTCSYNITVI